MNSSRNEIFRQLQEIALNYGRKKQSAQTGYLHYCSGLQEQEPHLPIPLLENFLFVLALLRSRTVDNINEAKTILEGLLHFQNRIEGGIGVGNFPIYLHEYPNCKDRFLGVHIGVVIYWILNQFHQVLGQELKKRLEESLIAVMRHSIKTHAEKPAPYAIALKIAASAIAAGKSLQVQDFATYGHSLLESLQRDQDRSAWYCPSSMGMMLTALTMIYPNMGDSPWSRFWEHLSHTWHRQTSCYAGPALKEWQQGEEPQVTLYDLFLGYFSEALSSRMLKEHPVHLEAVLISPREEQLNTPSFPFVMEGEMNGAKWKMFHGEHLASTVIEIGQLVINPNVEKGYHPLRIVWGNQQRVHTFVCQGGNSLHTQFTISPESIQMHFMLNEPAEEEDREGNREISFYIDAFEGLEFLVSGHKSSTFLLKDTLSIRSKDCRFELTFSLEKGEGKFLGHRSLGNRPSQLCTKGHHRYSAFDWHIFLRTIRRSPACSMNVLLKLHHES